MMDLAVTALVIAFFALAVACKAKYCREGNPKFFDLDNSQAMRGFWCIIVILVHVPAAYQNRIQDMAGSFAFVGVTYFFLTSAYGISRKFQKQPESIMSFWKGRLLKLIVPQLIVNVLALLVSAFVLKEKFDILILIEVNHWIIWLLVCYLIFWLSAVLLKKPEICIAAACLAAACVSLAVYVLKDRLPVHSWPAEMYGFIWGLLLSAAGVRFVSVNTGRWPVKCMAACAVSVFLGVIFLRYKHAAFFGDYVLRILLGLAILVFVLILNSKISIGSKLSSFLGKISFEMYLIHGIVFDVMVKALPGAGSGVFILLSVLLTIASSAAVYYASAFTLRMFSGKTSTSGVVVR